jgi:hypothetical protein
MRSTTLAFLTAAAVSSAPAGALSYRNVEGTTLSVTLQGYVPLACRVSVARTSASELANTGSLGTLQEFCNNPRGYRLFVDHSPGLASSRLVIDGQAVLLSHMGTTLISETNQPRMAARTLFIELGHAQPDGTLVFRMEPL